MSKNEPATQTAGNRLKPVRSLSGHDALCHVCWEPVYRLWVDRDDDPAGKCMHGHKRAHECPEAMARAHNTGEIAKMRAHNTGEIAKMRAQGLIE